MNIRTLLLIALLGVSVFISLAPYSVSAQSSLAERRLCEGTGGNYQPGSGECTSSGPTIEGTIGTITNTLLFVIGALAVIMIIVGGIRFVISGGDQSKVTSAKNTILYAVIGLVIAIAAYAVVNFVIATFA